MKSPIYPISRGRTMGKLQVTQLWDGVRWRDRWRSGRKVWRRVSLCRPPSLSLSFNLSLPAGWNRAEGPTGV
ncbi:hypothetical protein E2C01_088330 [Portunus trituberculatus]|uniref:Uncharacterized protein n=1 Tax=Portunus trituberculatus TaxID=210409 RepID=A0A5B7JJ31_PORTR|nr:hypothetical protein [Portunus trituberculatus]